MNTDAQAEAWLASLPEEHYKQVCDHLYNQALVQCQRMAVYDHDGRVYVPVLDPYGRIDRYGSYREATDVLDLFLENDMQVTATHAEDPKSFARYLAKASLQDVKEHVTEWQDLSDDELQSKIVDHLLTGSARFLLRPPRRTECMLILARRLRRGDTNTR